MGPDGTGRGAAGWGGPELAVGARSPGRVLPSSAVRAPGSVRPGRQPRESGDGENALPNHPHSFPHSLAPPSPPGSPT